MPWESFSREVARVSTFVHPLVINACISLAAQIGYGFLGKTHACWSGPLLQSSEASGKLSFTLWATVTTPPFACLSYLLHEPLRLLRLNILFTYLVCGLQLLWTILWATCFAVILFWSILMDFSRVLSLWFVKPYSYPQIILIHYLLAMIV